MFSLIKMLNIEETVKLVPSKRKSSNWLEKERKKFRKERERTKEKAGERKEADMNEVKKAKEPNSQSEASLPDAILSKGDGLGRLTIDSENSSIVDEIMLLEETELADAAIAIGDLTHSELDDSFDAVSTPKPSSQDGDKTTDCEHEENTETEESGSIYTLPSSDEEEDSGFETGGEKLKYASAKLQDVMEEKEIYTITQEKYHTEIPEPMIAPEIDGSKIPKERVVSETESEKEIFLEKAATDEAKTSVMSSEIDGSKIPKERFISETETQKETFQEKDTTDEANASVMSEKEKTKSKVNEIKTITEIRETEEMTIVDEQGNEVIFQDEEDSQEAIKDKKENQNYCIKNANEPNMVIESYKKSIFNYAKADEFNEGGDDNKNLTVEAKQIEEAGKMGKAMEVEIQNRLPSEEDAQILPVTVTQEEKATTENGSGQKKTRLEKNMQMLIEDWTGPEESQKNEDDIQNVLDRNQKLPFLPENHCKIYPPLPLGSKHFSLKLSKPDSLGYAILDDMVIPPLQTEKSLEDGMSFEPIEITGMLEIEGSKSCDLEIDQSCFGDEDKRSVEDKVEEENESGESNEMTQTYNDDLDIETEPVNSSPAKDFLANKTLEDPENVGNFSIQTENKEPVIKKKRGRPKHTNKIIKLSGKDDILHSALDCSLLQHDMEDKREVLNKNRKGSPGFREKENNTIDAILPEEKNHTEIPELMMAPEIDGSEITKERLVSEKEKKSFLEKDATDKAKASGMSEKGAESDTSNEDIRLLKIFSSQEEGQYRNQDGDSDGQMQQIEIDAPQENTNIVDTDILDLQHELDKLTEQLEEDQVKKVEQKQSSKKMAKEGLTDKISSQQGKDKPKVKRLVETMGEFEYEGSFSSAIDVDLSSCDTSSNIIKRQSEYKPIKVGSQKPNDVKVTDNDHTDQESIAKTSSKDKVSRKWINTGETYQEDPLIEEQSSRTKHKSVTKLLKINHEKKSLPEPKLNKTKQKDKRDQPAEAAISGRRRTQQLQCYCKVTSTVGMVSCWSCPAW